MTTQLRDPVCDMPVDPATSLSSSRAGRAFFFCSEYCRRFFEAHPESYADRPPVPDPEEDPARRRLAYFSMEIGLDSRMPIYSGGLGILAGDTLRSFADLGLPVVGVSLLYRRGYFRQALDPQGGQTEAPADWNPAQFVRPLPPTVRVTIAGRSIVVRACRYDVRSTAGHTVPVLLLDTDVEGNEPADKDLTGVLYGGDERTRLSQEIVLGIGGVRVLRALGYTGIRRFHMNEGHSSLLALELLAEETERPLTERIERVKRRCVFTTHTPVPAGHDQFSYELVADLLGEPIPFEELRMLGGADRLNMTRLALNLSHYVNGVAKSHEKVSQEMFPRYPIASITNGVHSFTWTCDQFRALYDRFIPDWANDPFSLRHAMKIPVEEIWKAHFEAKLRLLAEVRRRTSVALDGEVFTIGFARRATAYKRADLLFIDPEELARIARAAGPMQVIFAGKAHPRDEPGKELIQRVFRAADRLRNDVPIVYLAEYDIGLARLLASGVDLWLNTPRRPLEASGTSGMKAAHNGVPSLSVLDGWWVEGNLEGITGWSIGNGSTDGGPSEDARDAADLYMKLRTAILPLYYGNRSGWGDVMKRCVALNASFFNTHRMVQQYASTAYA
jgi:starch phosphorylase